MSPDITQAGEAQFDLLTTFGSSKNVHIYPCFEEVIIMAENVTGIIIHNNKTIPFDFIKEFEPPFVTDLGMI